MYKYNFDDIDGFTGFNAINNIELNKNMREINYSQINEKNNDWVDDIIKELDKRVKVQKTSKTIHYNTIPLSSKSPIPDLENYLQCSNSQSYDYDEDDDVDLDYMLANDLSDSKVVRTINGEIFICNDIKDWVCPTKNELPNAIDHLMKLYFSKYKKHRHEINYHRVIDFLKSNSNIALSLDLIQNPMLIHFIDFSYDLMMHRTCKKKRSYISIKCIKTTLTQFQKSKGKHTEKYLNSITNGDENLRQKILEMIGCILSGITLKKIFFIQEPHDSGKSTLIKLIELVLPQSCTFHYNDLEELLSPFGTGNLIDTKLTVINDMPKSCATPKSIFLLKQLSGRDPINMRVKYKNPVLQIYKGQTICVSNHAFSVDKKYKDNAFASRFEVIPMVNTITEEDIDYDLLEKLEEEKGYLCRISLEALKGLEYRNKQFTPINIPDGYGLVYDNEVKNDDTIKHDFEYFCNNYIVIEEGSRVTVKKIYQIYSLVCYNRLEYNTFSKKLKDRFGEYYKQYNSMAAYSGINLNLTLYDNDISV